MSLSNTKITYTTIKKKIETENSFIKMEHNIFSFVVAKDASKLTIKQALVELYPGLEVLSVKTMIRKGKLKRTKRGYNKKSDKKIAMVRCSGKVELLNDLRVEVKEGAKDGAS